MLVLEEDAYLEIVKACVVQRNDFELIGDDTDLLVIHWIRDKQFKHRAILHTLSSNTWVDVQKV